MVKVLMIDDDKDMCEEMAEILEGEGIEVIAVTDPVRGLKLANEKKYDLLILDLKMPKLNGYDILSRVKSADPKIKVMVITGAPLSKIADIESRGGDESLTEILGMADAVVNKSADIGIILEKIKGLTLRA